MGHEEERGRYNNDNINENALVDNGSVKVGEVHKRRDQESRGSCQHNQKAAGSQAAMGWTRG